MESRHPYLTRQLIAYIGNKRALLPFLEPVFAELSARAEVQRFVDPFAGSGSVARLGKYMGFEVAAADWEHYAWILNAAALEVNAADRRNLFPELGGVEAAFDHFHRIGEAAAEAGTAGGPPARADAARGYIAGNYAPRETHAADFRTERLFYTAENARYIDAVRDAIEKRYPAGHASETRPSSASTGLGVRNGSPGRRERLLLLAALLYEASTHANTSGVFKAYHKGFGGHGRDALGRIMAPMRIEAPELIDGAPSRTEEADAAEFLSRNPADLVYLDPPYNSHQYGSNYFMLNTIARWDKPPVPDECGPDGRLLHKAGIRGDWRRTRSDFCSKGRAETAFREVLDAVDARFLVLSYSSDGIVPVEQIVDMLLERGSVELFATDYTQYRGGRQSISRGTANVEFALAVTTRERHGRAAQPAPASRASAAGEVNVNGAAAAARGREEITRFLLAREVASQLQEAYVPARVREAFLVSGDSVVLSCGRKLPMSQLHRFAVSPSVVGELSAESLEDLRDRLPAARCVNRQEEAGVLVELIRGGEAALDGQTLKQYRRRLLQVLRKFAYRKYEIEFEKTAGEIEEACREHPGAFDGVAAGVGELRELMRRRARG
ncbi:MAG: adenine methyltransferase [Spirochaetes bacterium]|jgi:adenine-specific DNA-methyltransferase|nr:adenine methyltransferase [Spirochaetota bacterium]